MINSHVHKVDVAVIGGGPAGLSTALHLLQLDPSWSKRIIVLEEEIHPCHKLCAGGIISFGLK
jgi:flavin-dependent dehydrogenase